MPVQPPTSRWKRFPGLRSASLEENVWSMESCGARSAIRILTGASAPWRPSREQNLVGTVSIRNLGFLRPFGSWLPIFLPTESTAGNWTDADFVRALRRGIGHDGRTLVDTMPSAEFSHLSDEDLASVIVYLRSLPAIHIERPKTVMPKEATSCSPEIRLHEVETPLCPTNCRRLWLARNGLNSGRS